MALRSFSKGKYDNIPETYFYMAGGIDEVVRSYEEDQKKAA